MTRFHIVSTLAVVSAAIALALHNFIFVILILFAVFIVVGLGVFFPQIKLFGNFICRGSKKNRRVALSFDDGPDPNSTPQLLELLRAEKIRATFFCIGNRVEKNPELAAQIVRDGHLLENHTYSHNYLTSFFSVARLREELTQTQNIIKKISGIAPKFFRPPIGHSTPRTFRVARELNLQVIGWSARSLDTISRDPKKIVARVVSQLSPGGIILLHDGNLPAAQIVATTKSLVDALRLMDYEIVRLDELLK
jgi:peptidoglycan/xylan/chitin deacetylase (PgdA/CDA1 family)